MLISGKKMELLTLAKEITLAILARQSGPTTSAHACAVIKDIHADLVKLSKVEVE